MPAGRKTIKTYLHYNRKFNRKFLNFARKSPKEIFNEDIKRYLEYLANREISNATLNLAINALKFYYTQILNYNNFYNINSAKSRYPDEIGILRDESSLRHLYC